MSKHKVPEYVEAHEGNLRWLQGLRIHSLRPGSGRPPLREVREPLARGSLPLVEANGDEEGLADIYRSQARVIQDSINLLSEKFALQLLSEEVKRIEVQLGDNDDFYIEADPRRLFEVDSNLEAERVIRKAMQQMGARFRRARDTSNWEGTTPEKLFVSSKAHSSLIALDSVRPLVPAHNPPLGSSMKKA